MKLSTLTSIYSPKYPAALLTILEDSNYNENKYISKLWATKDFSKVQKSKLSKKSKVLLLIIQLCIVLNLAAGVFLIYLGIADKVVGGIAFGAALILAYPIIWSHILPILSYLGQLNIKEVK